MYIEVMEENDGNIYTPEDNFYGEIKEEEFAEKLQNLLQEQFGDQIDVDTNMTCVMGGKIGEELNLDKVLQGEIKIDHSTLLIVKTEVLEKEEYKKKSDKLEEFIKEKKIYGSYTVKFVNELNLDEILYEEHFFG